MRAVQIPEPDPCVEQAVAELREIVQERYPAATFDIFEADDPVGFYLRATVDVDDTDEVMDLVVDRLLELQVSERLPVYFIPARPLKRVLQELQRR